MFPKNIDQWMDDFIADCIPGSDPRDVPSVSERQAMSDYLHGRISEKEAAIAYTRDAIAGNTVGDVRYLIYNMAQDLPETHDRLLGLAKAISQLPNEPRASGKIQCWGSLTDLQWDLREFWMVNLENSPSLSRNISPNLL